MNHYLLTQTLRQDHEISDILVEEIKMQSATICLSPFENIVSKAILDAQASPIAIDMCGTGQKTGNCKDIENIAVKRACDIFNCKHANVKINSSLQAIQIIIENLIENSDAVLTTGVILGAIQEANSSNPKIYNIISMNAQNEEVRYNLIDYDQIDYDQIRALTLKHKPKLIIANLSNSTKNIDWQILKEISNENNALLIANIDQLTGLIAGKAAPSPFPYADIIVGSTNNTLRGPAGGLILTNSTELFSKINSYKSNNIDSANHSTSSVLAAKAICFEQAKSSEFKQYAHHTVDNARAMCQIFIDEGLDVLDEMTDTNIIIINLDNLNITARKAMELLKKFNIIIGDTIDNNSSGKNQNTSIILLGLQLLTSFGITYEECQTLAKFIAKILKGKIVSPASLISIFNKIQHIYKSIFPNIL